MVTAGPNVGPFVAVHILLCSLPPNLECPISLPSLPTFNLVAIEVQYRSQHISSVHVYILFNGCFGCWRKGRVEWFVRDLGGRSLFVHRLWAHIGREWKLKLTHLVDVSNGSIDQESIAPTYFDCWSIVVDVGAGTKTKFLECDAVG
jgi:hypothetical protein